MSFQEAMHLEKERQRRPMSDKPLSRKTHYDDPGSTEISFCQVVPPEQVHVRLYP